MRKVVDSDVYLQLKFNNIQSDSSNQSEFAYL